MSEDYIEPGSGIDATSVVQLERVIREHMRNNLSLRSIHDAALNHLHHLRETASALAPQAEAIYQGLAEQLLFLASTDDVEQRENIRRRIASYRRSHELLLATITNIEVQRTANDLWDIADVIRDFIESLIKTMRIL